MARPSRSETGVATVSVRNLMLRFTAAGVVATLLLGAAIAFLARQAGTREAITRAREVARLVVLAEREVRLVVEDDGLGTRVDLTLPDSLEEQ